jgi:hypothetical protein
MRLKKETFVKYIEPWRLQTWKWVKPTGLQPETSKKDAKKAPEAAFQWGGPEVAVLHALIGRHQ